MYSFCSISGDAMDKELTRVTRESLIFSIERALSNAASLWPRKRWPECGYNEHRPIAEAVVEDLCLERIRVFRGPPQP